MMLLSIKKECIILEQTDTAYKRYIYALGTIKAMEKGTIIDSVYTKDSLYYLLTDHLGSVIAASDEDGDIVWRNEYTPYGENVVDEESNDDFAFFTGKMMDNETGLYYFNARWYDPKIGRFMSEDPIRDGSNWYSYCSNNPLTKIDTTGLADEDNESKSSIWAKSVAAAKKSNALSYLRSLHSIPPSTLSHFSNALGFGGDSYTFSLASDMSSLIDGIKSIFRTKDANDKETSDFNEEDQTFENDLYQKLINEEISLAEIEKNPVFWNFISEMFTGLENAVSGNSSHTDSM